MNGNNFALELTVGIEDLFTQHKKRIEKEAKKLEQDFKGLQKTAGDVTEFRRMQEGLEQLGRESGTTSREFQQQEQQLQQYASALRRAEVNINNLTQEQRRLNTQLKETEEAAKSVRALSDGMGGIIGGAVAGVAAGSMFASGMSTIQLEKQAALQTGKDTGYFASSVERDWRSSTMRDTGATAEQVMAARVQAHQTGVDEVSARRMAERSVMLNRAMPAADMQEIMRAMLTMNKGFGTDSDTNADLIYRIASGAGDRANDLLDTFNEYSLLMKDAGISAEQFSAMLMAGAKSGAFNYDKLADGVKESIKARLTDGGELESLMGSGTKKGEIDTLVKDKSMREALKSAIGEFRQTNEKGGDLAAPWMKVMTLVSSLYQKDPAAAKNIMERVGGTQFSEDLGASSVKTMVEALADPIKVLGDYQGKLADGVKDSFSAMERLSTSWEGATDRFSQAVGDFAEAQSPIIELLASGLDKGGQLIADNPGTALGVTAGALVLKQQAIRAAYNSLKDRWFKGGGAGLEAAEALAKGAPEMATPKSATKGVPSWMDHRLSGAPTAPTPPPATSGGWLQSLKEGAGKTLGGKGGKMLGWLPALLFGGAQIYDAAQSGDNDQLITTTAGVGGSLAGGAAGAYGGAALGTAFFPGIGTAVGGVAGGILGSILGEEGVKAITEGVMGWFNDGKNGAQNDADKEMERLLPPMAKTTTTSTPTTPPPVQIALSHQLAISVTPDFTNSADIEAAIIQALRNSTPELVQELKDSLERVMQSMDYAQPSA
ncbi:hypothetical protein CAK78_12865 [Aeromonas sp. A35_P]|uniref:phage tail tape measure protein n=1 Tax=Aeromonas sp. A35_P TaxID=1983805 RepID=UPI000BD792B5|nr:phage tail tape measure protein [Aeromonas sp. A35_P]OZG41549.1 hypothetical protein CAK78_12865 [Aeromonas sp. A35_P]